MAYSSFVKEWKAVWGLKVSLLSCVQRTCSLTGNIFFYTWYEESGERFTKCLGFVSFEMRGCYAVRGTSRPFQIISVVILVLGSGFHYKEQSAFSVDRALKEKHTALEMWCLLVQGLGHHVEPFTTSLISLMCFCGI